MGKGMTVAAGNRREVQVRKVREGGFTEEKKQIVLDHLAGCANLLASAAASSIARVAGSRQRRPWRTASRR